MDREQVTELARACSIDWHRMFDDEGEINRLERFATAVAAAVKEEDARICEGIAKRVQLAKRTQEGALVCESEIRASFKE